eukprot:750499-Hanusia_phi.AAC.4
MLAAASIAAATATSAAKNTPHSASLALHRNSLETNEEIKLFVDEAEGLENVIPKASRIFDEHLSKLHHSGIWQERRLIACPQFVYVLMPSEAPEERSGHCEIAKGTASDLETQYILLNAGYLAMFESEQEFYLSVESRTNELSLHSTKILQLNNVARSIALATASCKYTFVFGNDDEYETWSKAFKEHSEFAYNEKQNITLKIPIVEIKEVSPTSELSFKQSSSNLPHFRFNRQGSEVDKATEDGEVVDSFLFQISTIPEGYNSGRSFFFRTNNALAGRIIVDNLNTLALSARKSLRRKSDLAVIQKTIKLFYNSTPFQSLVALMLVLNFLANVSEQQLRPQPDTPTSRLYDNLDIFFTGDLLAVYNRAHFELHLKLLVELRHGRMEHLRLLHRDLVHHAAGLIVVAQPAAPADVSNVPNHPHVWQAQAAQDHHQCHHLQPLPRRPDPGHLSSRHLSMGVEFFSSQAPVEFGNFFRGFYTLFGVIAFGKWPDDVLPPFKPDGSLNVGIVAYIYSFVLFVVLVLLQVLVAVLLENFFSAAKREREKLLMEHEDQNMSSAANPLQSLLSSLSVQFATPCDLEQRMDLIFQILDCDRGGTLSYDEFSEGLHKMFPVSNRLTEDDFFSFTGGSQELTAPQFRLCLWKELKSFILRRMTEASMLLEGNTESQIMLTAMKMVMVMADHTFDEFEPKKHHYMRELSIPHGSDKFDKTSSVRSSLSGEHPGLREEVQVWRTESIAMQQKCVNLVEELSAKIKLLGPPLTDDKQVSLTLQGDDNV